MEVEAGLYLMALSKKMTKVSTRLCWSPSTLKSLVWSLMVIFWRLAKLATFLIELAILCSSSTARILIEVL